MLYIGKLAGRRYQRSNRLTLRLFLDEGILLKVFLILVFIRGLEAKSIKRMLFDILFFLGFFSTFLDILRCNHLMMLSDCKSNHVIFFFNLRMIGFRLWFWRSASLFHLNTSWGINVVIIKAQRKSQLILLLLQHR